MVPGRKVFLTTCNGAKQPKTDALTGKRVLSIPQKSYSIQGRLIASLHAHPACMVRNR